MVAAMISCNKTRRSTGRAYMPDMSYSRAYETYASTEALDKAGVHYTSKPVEGTVARGDMYAYTLKNDSQVMYNQLLTKERYMIALQLI
jgi:hypothetical protein